jgi:hypothetical protein
MKAARLLIRCLVDPRAAASLSASEWTALLTCARAEQMIGSLADRLDGLDVPPVVAAILQDARANAVFQRRQALWEAQMCRRVLAPLDIPFVLLKGTAFVAADLAAGRGRSIGDLDILVPRVLLDHAEAALLAAGWEWVKPDPYDDLYYRRWMHELPPLIHRERDRMIDVHHTILPLTARPRPDAGALIAASRALPAGLRVLAAHDMVVHAAAHLLADGDLAGGLRNLWDIDRLVREHRTPAFWIALAVSARRDGLEEAVARALRLARTLFKTQVDPVLAGRDRFSDHLFVARLLARDDWGRARNPALRLAFYIRSHWLRMPPAMLVRHLWIKARRPGTSGA